MGLLLNKGYHPLKFEGSGSKGTRVIERKRSVTDGQTDRRTRQKRACLALATCKCNGITCLYGLNLYQRPNNTKHNDINVNRYMTRYENGSITSFNETNY